MFVDIFNDLRADGFFEKTIAEIQNDDLFKLSPFKALNDEQKGALENLLDGLFDDLANQQTSTAVVSGEPGTGKTILAIYMLKLLRDIQLHPDSEDVEGETRYSDYFVEGNRQLLKGKRIGFVVPQQSLRESVQRVFKKVPGLDSSMVLSPFDVGASAARYDILVVDEAHRLTQYAAQAMGTITRDYRNISQSLFGEGWESHTQLDWIMAKSDHQVFLLDLAQRVRPADAPTSHFRALSDIASARGRSHALWSQMRLNAGSNYVQYIRNVLNNAQFERASFEDYDLRFFDDFDELYSLIQQKEDAEGLSRIVAGYAWKWVSRKPPATYDIALGSHKLKWNKKQRDWINSPGSRYEVGSIHTVQGYDLNYAGVVIGRDLRYDPENKKILFDKNNYFDTRGKSNNNLLGIKYTDEDLLELVTNIYGVLLTRGMRGTYIYVCDGPLREYLRQFF